MTILNLADTGIYTISEAANLTKVSPTRIRGWLKGYRQKDGGRSEAVLSGQIDPIDGKLALGFLDLMELRFINFFLEQGVKWNTIKIAAKNAKRILQVSHPFATKFVTDKLDIFEVTKVETQDPALINLVSNQMAFLEILEPLIIGGLSYDEQGYVQKWYPMNDIPEIVLDPKRSFGHPILDSSSIPTATIAEAVDVEGDADFVASIFDITTQDVMAAVKFEDLRQNQ